MRKYNPFGSMQPDSPFGGSTRGILTTLSGAGATPHDIHNTALQYLGYVAEDKGGTQRKSTPEGQAYQVAKAAARGNQGSAPYQKNIQLSSAAPKPTDTGEGNTVMNDTWASGPQFLNP